VLSVGVEDPLTGLNMRITHRTLLVLAAIAELGERGPKPCNREVAEQAGITDPGQISKLLARLEGLGLIANNGDGQALGERNAWTLTARGEEVEQAARAQTATTSH
jgi:DNA-binding MarR family transcriptional regulator